MKFLYCQDTHIKGVNPANRSGNYYAEVMLKMKEIIDLSKKLKVDKVYHGGDLFDSAKVSDNMVDDLLDMIEEAGIPWEIVWGNHDEIGHNLELSKSTSLAHIMRRSKLVKHIIPETKSIYEMGDKEPLRILSSIEGFDYYHNIEADLKETGLNSTCPEAGFKVAILHAFVTLKPFLPKVMHVMAKDINTNFDVVLVAHYHKQWGMKEINGTKFVNIGCIGRTDIDEINEVPQVLLVDTNTRELKIIDLKSAKPGEEIFDLEKVKLSKEFDEDIDNFIKSLNNVEFKGLNLRGLCEHVFNLNNVDKEVIGEILNRIGRFENE